MPELTDYERGMKEGRVDAMLEAHTLAIARINGSIDRSATNLAKVNDSLRGLASDIRSLQEDGRIAEERVRVAAATLATETERRREELAATAATTTSTWSLRSNKAQVVGAFIAFLALTTPLIVYIIFH